MTDLSRWLWFPGAKFILVACMVIVLIDISLRVFPSATNHRIAAYATGEDLLVRRVPSPKWNSWYEELKAAAAALEAETARQREQEVVTQTIVEPPPRIEKDVQQGDLESFKVGQLTYRLLGVFNKRHPQSGSDSFGVLRGEGQTLQVRRGDVVGAYRVALLTPRSVTFESTADERVVTLWLFGKGPI